jgi:DNA-binding NarL/FixJ family response regulator
MKRTTVVLADDHALVLEGLRRILRPPDFDVVGMVSDGLALVKATERLRPDVVVVDVSMPLLNGIEAARQIRATNQRTKIVFLSMHPEVAYVSEALQAGGSAYVLKSSVGIEMLEALRHVLLGKTYLTPSIDQAALDVQMKREPRTLSAIADLTSRQREVLQLVAEGHSTKEIAEILHVSPRTVEFHRYRLMETLGLHTIAQLVQYAMKHRVISAK